MASPACMVTLIGDPADTPRPYLTLIGAPAG